MYMVRMMTESGPVKSQKRMRLKSCHLDRTSLVNTGVPIGLSEKFFLQDTACSQKHTK